MLFEWDERKNAANKAKHEIDFEEAKLIFEGPVVTWSDVRTDYGEIREVSIGLIRSVVAVTVIHTDRNGVTRIISARLENRREKDIYLDHYR